jgi:hypothetical protein
MFQMFHPFQMYLHMLQWLYTYVANVCFTLFRYITTGAASPRALTRGASMCCTRRPTAPAPLGVVSIVEHAAGSTHMYVCCAPSLPLALGHARYALSRIGVRAMIPLSLSHAARSLSY